MTSYAARDALSLYARILRAARALPTSNRRAYIRKKARDEFEAARGASGERQSFLFAYGEVSVDNIVAAAQHLSQNALFAPDGAVGTGLVPKGKASPGLFDFTRRK
jgi:hypothetical protein